MDIVILTRMCGTCWCASAQQFVSEPTHRLRLVTLMIVEVEELIWKLVACGQSRALFVFGLRDVNFVMARISPRWRFSEFGC
ncbi:hypothetical protein EV2_029977 [Malus domestica]